ncbi:hypothetical protein RZN22_18275 [Bacillaceae bacterium S4-13-58]
MKPLKKWYQPCLRKKEILNSTLLNLQIFQTRNPTVLAVGVVREAGTVKPDGYFFGKFHTNKDLNQLTIEVFAREEKYDQGSWTGADGLMFSFPAETREEAIEITDQLVEEYERDGDKVSSSNLRSFCPE